MLWKSAVEYSTQHILNQPMSMNTAGIFICTTPWPGMNSIPFIENMLTN